MDVDKDVNVEEKNGRTLRELRYGSFRRVPGAYKDQALPGASRIPITK